MPDVVGPFDAATFAQASWYRDRGYLEPSGVQGLPAATPAAGDLGLTASGFGLTLALGRAHVRGAYYERTGTAWTDTVPANTSTAGPRRDLIVLRRDLTAKTVVPARVQGTAAATPADPALTQNDTGVWELPLFRVTAPASSGTPLTIEDLRVWIDPNGNGMVHPLIPATIQSGWGSVTSHPVRVVRSAGNRVRSFGRHTNLGSFTVNGTQFPIVVPAGYRPAAEFVFVVPFASPASGLGLVVATLLTDGRLRYDAQLTGPTPIPAGTAFFLDMLEWHLTYPTS